MQIASRQGFLSLLLWTLLDTCTNLSTLYSVFHSSRKLESINKLFSVLNENRHKKIKFLGMTGFSKEALVFHVNPAEYKQLVSEFCALIIKCDLKLLKVESSFLHTLEASQYNQIAPRIMSMQDLHLSSRHLGQTILNASFPEMQIWMATVDFARSHLNEEPNLR